MGMADRLSEWRWRAAGHYDHPLPERFLDGLHGAHALEIGGPSGVFMRAGLLPAYAACAGLDGVQWAEETLWHGRQRGEYAPEGDVTGRVFVTEGATLEGVPDARYDAVLSSHVIEHFANPLRALDAWRRVCKPGGAVLLVAPHKAGTFDRRRPLTPLEHVIADYERGVGEDDLTHLEETLLLHDRARDAPGAGGAEWERDRRENARHRVLHHHVFATRSLVELLAHAGVALTALEVRHPHDIYVAGRFAAARPAPVDASVVEPALRHSPFRMDRA